MLSVSRISKRYEGAQRNALNEVSFEVQPGSICCIIGRNGAGKSTMMSAMVGLTPLSSGTVLFDGQSLPHSMALRRRVGFAAQQEALYPLLSGRENLEAFGRLAGVSRPVLLDRIDELACQLQIADLLNQQVRQLSGGERRRVHVAASLVGEVDLVILDEPTAGVDPHTRANVLDLARSVAARGAMVLYSTHYLHEVEQLDSNVVMLERGELIASGSVSSLLATHGSSTIEMGFPNSDIPGPAHWGSHWRGDTLVIDVQRPNEELPAILQEMGERLIYLRSLEVVEPTLDRVFLSLTGRAIEGDAALLGGE